MRAFPGARSWNRANPWIYMGSINGVKKAALKHGSIICPLDADPLSFTWPAAGLSITVVADEKHQKEAVRLAQALIRDGAALVACVSREGWFSFHKQHPTENDSVHAKV
jgi:hypothetical protein